MKIRDLRCEYATNPLGVGVVAPRLFWKLDSPRQGARQIAYRLRVASTIERLETADLWDSGRVQSNRTTHLEYGGVPLSSRQRAFWQVEVEDETGAFTRSEIARWEMGLLAPGDWQGQWIGGNLCGGPQTGVPAPFLRREFGLEKTVKSARLYVTALGLYECEINGQRVGDHIFAPGWTDYRRRVQYQTYDVTSLLQSGENVWGAILGDGWYCGHIEWRGRQRYGDKPAFLAQLEIEFEDGEKQIVRTDANWKFAYGPILENDLIQGESYDARHEFSGWSAPNFDDSRWATVEINAAPDIEISAPLGPPVRKTQEIVPIADPQRIARWPEPEYIFDMGQNMVGRVRLKVSGPRGATIRLRFAEVLEGGPAATEGRITTENLRSARQTDFYTLRGDGEEVWEPRFTVHGFRYVELTGFPGVPTRDTITGIVLHSDTPQTGAFECSEPLVNQFQRNIDWGQRGNFVDVPTDCPQRDERLGWTGDAQVFIQTAAFNRDVAGFFTEWARDIADAQTREGGIPATAPVANDLGGGALGISPDSRIYDSGPAWADAALICPWTIYQAYGDRRILEENYPVFERFLSYLQSTSRDGVRCYEGCGYFRGHGDWLALDGSGQNEGATPNDLIGTAFYAHDADLMSRIAQVLGKNEDAARYAALFEEVKTAFNRHFVSPDGLVAPSLQTPSLQTPCLLALQFDLLPENGRSQVVDQLVANIHRNGGKLSTGFVGTPYLNAVLTRFGCKDTAYDLLLQKDWPGWLYAVTQGATTIWERWDGWTHDRGFQTPDMNSFNHYAYGAIGAWFYESVAGIQLDSQVPGYQKFRLQPQPSTHLSWIKAHFDTLHGRIESAWTFSDGVFKWQFTVPPNTTAQIIPPQGDSFEASPGCYTLQMDL